MNVVRGIETCIKKFYCHLTWEMKKASEKPSKTAVQLAQSYNSVLHVMTVVPDFGMSIVGTYFPEDYEESMLTDTKEKLNAYVSKHIPESIKSRQIVAHGTIYNEILDYANKVKVNLIVIASHRPELKDYLVGPNAARVVRHANCSTMIVRP